MPAAGREPPRCITQWTTYCLSLAGQMASSRRPTDSCISTRELLFETLDHIKKGPTMYQPYDFVWLNFEIREVRRSSSHQKCKNAYLTLLLAYQKEGCLVSGSLPSPAQKGSLRTRISGHPRRRVSGHTSMTPIPWSGASGPSAECYQLSPSAICPAPYLGIGPGCRCCGALQSTLPPCQRTRPS